MDIGIENWKKEKRKKGDWELEYALSLGRGKSSSQLHNSHMT